MSLPAALKKHFNVHRSMMLGFATAWVSIPAAHAEPDAEGQAATQLDPVEVVAPRLFDGLRVETDPRDPTLPIPATDGGAYLQSFPGFSVSRKGGTSGDPELRGQGGSRLNILVDGAPSLGSGGGRMDPPTSYAYPQLYDRVEVLRGPQSVRYGSVGAGVVRFERDTPFFDEPGVTGFASTTVGSFSRFDSLAEVTAGDRLGYVRMLGMVSTQDDYRSGDDDRVHSKFQRWAGSVSLGWTPDPDTTVELTYDRSDKEAAYDERPLDAIIFDRTAYRLRAERENVTDWLAGVEAELFYDYTEHEMDNFRLRDVPDPDGMEVQGPAIQFPDRRSIGGRLSGEILVAEPLTLTVGVDYQQDQHGSAERETGPFAFGDAALQFRSLDREDALEMEQYGVFAELEHRWTDRDRMHYGLRADHNEATALRAPYALMMGNVEFDGIGDAEPGTSQTETLVSGFLRYARELADVPADVYAGIGRSARAPDFWERGGPPGRRGGFEVDPEVLTQLDVGVSYAGRRFQSQLGFFYGEFDDYLLVDYTQPGSQSEVINVDATHYGLEGELTWQIDQEWSTTATVAWVRADNDTADEPLAQTPPAEATLSVDYDAGRTFAGVLARAKARQDRIHEGFGSIYSEDQQETAGFATLDLYGGYRFTDQLAFSAGVNNALDRSYAEHIQRRGGGFISSADELIDEPGRNYWIRASGQF